MVGVDIAYDWPLWLHAVVWLPLTVGLCLAVLPTAKGALIGLQWALRMHGFGGASDEREAHAGLVPQPPAGPRPDPTERPRFRAWRPFRRAGVLFSGGPRPYMTSAPDGRAAQPASFPSG